MMPLLTYLITTFNALVRGILLNLAQLLSHSISIVIEVLRSFPPASSFRLTMESTEAETYLNSLINKTLRVYATDSRMFVGTFKCTDAVGIPNPLLMRILSRSAADWIFRTGMSC